jgi:hypothetical protein
VTTARVIFIHPDGTLPDWMFVIVESDTGIWYEQQYGGTACRQRRQQGFLVPVYSREARVALDALFVRELRGAGLWGGSRQPDEEILRKAADAVALINYWADDESGPVALILDADRAAHVDEAWIPVVTPHGLGVLVWHNSD